MRIKPSGGEWSRVTVNVVKIAIVAPLSYLISRSSTWAFAILTRSYPP